MQEDYLRLQRKTPHQCSWTRISHRTEILLGDWCCQKAWFSCSLSLGKISFSDMESYCCCCPPEYIKQTAEECNPFSLFQFLQTLSSLWIWAGEGSIDHAIDAQLCECWWSQQRLLIQSLAFYPEEFLKQKKSQKRPRRTLPPLKARENSLHKSPKQPASLWFPRPSPPFFLLPSSLVSISLVLLSSSSSSFSTGIDKLRSSLFFFRTWSRKPWFLLPPHSTAANPGFRYRQNFLYPYGASPKPRQ